MPGVGIARRRGEGLREVGDEVVDVFQADRQAQHVGGRMSAAGCWISESTPPSDTAWVNSRVADVTVDAAANPPRMRIAIIAPVPRICRSRTPRGSPSRPG